MTRGLRVHPTARLALLVGAVALPMVVSAAVLALRGWQPVGELAMAELRLRGFWAHPPDLGAVARLRVGDASAAHPGPLAYWLLYPVYALFGRSAAGLTLSVAVVAAAWSGATLVLVARRAGIGVAALLGAVVLVFVGGLGPVVVTQPWNPWLGIFPFLFFLVACWDVLDGHPWSLVGVALAGSVCVQAHVSYVPVVLAMAVLAVVVAVVRAARTARWRALAVPAAATAGVTVLAWAPVAVQQLFGHPGNLTLLWEGWNDRDLPPAGLGTALRVVAQHLDPFGPWATGGAVLPRRGVPLGTLVLAVLLAAVVLYGWRRRDVASWRRLLVLVATLGAATVAAVVGISRTTGVVYDYLVAWLPAVTALAVFAVGWAAWLWAGPAVLRSVSRRTAGTVAVVVLAVLCALSTVRLDDPPVPEPALSRTVSALATQVERVIAPDDRYLVRWTDPVFYGGTGFGLALRLERDGYDVGVDPTYRVEAMPYRVRTPSEADRTLWVITGDAIARWQDRSDVAEIASYDPRSAAARSAAAAGRADLVRRLTEIGGPGLAAKLATNHWDILFDRRVDERTKRDVIALAREGLPAAVFLGPADAAGLPGGTTSP